MRKLQTLLGIFMFLPCAVRGEVDLRSGEFVVAYSDVNLKGPIPISIERIYHSKSSYSGLFGPGWGSRFETYLEAQKNGVITVFEFGNGAETQFQPLKSAAWRSASGERLDRSQEGYVRTLSDGTKEYFSIEGKLKKISDLYGNTARVEYESNGKVKEIVDHLNRALAFQYDSDGRLKKIRLPDGKSSEYQFDLQGRLVSAQDVDGVWNTYSYTEALTKIEYVDGSSQVISYHGDSRNVRTVTHRGGAVAHYEYEGKKLTRSVVSAKGKTLSRETFEFGPRTQVSTFEGARTETTFDECCGRPLSIRSPAGVTTFKYDSNGRLREKRRGADVISLSYDSRSGKINRVTHHDRWVSFQYDAQGNMTVAKNSDGNGLKLVYDSRGRIVGYVDHLGRKLMLKYNELSEPIEVTVPVFGRIGVSYTEKGEIKKVDGNTQTLINGEVAAASRAVLEMLRPVVGALSR